MSGKKPEGGIEILDKSEAKTDKPKLYKVILHNDHRTPREFVVHVLGKIFKKSENAAVDIMMKAHTSGFSLVGVYSYEIAETKVYQAMQLAEEYQYPLLFTIDEGE